MSPTVFQVHESTDPALNDFRDIKDTARRREGTFIAESELVIRRLLESRFGIQSLLLTPQRYARLQTSLESLAPEVCIFVGPENLLSAIVGFPLHRGALALGIRTPDPLWSELLVGAQTVVIVENVVDPDNIGAVFRHSAAFGVDAVMLSPHCGDPLYRKAVRSAVGWSLFVPWCRLPDSQWPGLLSTLHTDGWQTIALSPDPRAVVLPRLMEQFGSTTRVALLLGSEHEGLTPEAMDQANMVSRIPMAGGVDSLNVATTAAIALYELARRNW